MNIKITLLPTTRTDLMCIACGMFRTELAAHLNGPAPNDWEPQVGCHKKCIPDIHVKRGGSNDPT